MQNRECIVLSEYVPESSKAEPRFFLSFNFHKTVRNLLPETPTLHFTPKLVLTGF